MVSYHHRREQNWGRHAKAEMAATALIFVLIVGTLAVFLLVYHDLTFRISTP